MTFYEWDSIERAALFGGIFLVSLFAVLWVWYDSSLPGRQDAVLWRSGLSALVALTVPAVFMGAANLDPSRETLLNTLGWLGIGAGVAALAGVAAYAIWGRAGVPFVESVTLPPVTVTPPPTVRAAPAPQPPAKVEVPRAYLFVKAGPDQGRQFPLPDSARIGRGSDCTIVLDDRRVSGEHALVKHANEQFVFTDLHSANGSFLVVEGREEPIRGSQVLLNGDTVRVGHTLLEFVDVRNGRGR